MHAICSLARQMFAKFLSIALLCALLANSSHAAPMNSIPVAPSYRGFVAADNADTLDMGVQSATREKLGSPMSIITHGQKREREMKNGYVTLFATGAQTTLRVPLGWYAVESKDIDKSLVFSPGQSVKIVARSPVDNYQFQFDRDAFNKFKKKSVEQTRAHLKEMGLTAGPIEMLELPGDAFAVRALKATDKQGAKFSYFEHFAQRASKAERDNYWTKVAAKEPLSPLQHPLAMSLLAPADKFEKYLPLFGLMVRDAGINWTREDSYSPDEFRAQVSQSAEFDAVAAQAVALLKAGDVAGFQKRFPEAYAGNDPKKVAQHLKTVVAPFFQKMPATIERERYTVARDRDPIDQFFQVTMVRDFKLSDENFPSYVIVMQRVGNKVALTGIGTTDDPGGV